MTRCIHILLLCLSALLPSHAMAGETVRAFTPESFAAIKTARAGKPFILGFWSVSCSHCPSELRALASLRQRHPRAEVVLVSTDTPAEAPEAARLAATYGLAKTELWVFADEIPERLRFAIDRRWQGELPRTYFFDATGAHEAVSGVIPADALEAWARAHFGNPGG